MRALKRKGFSDARLAELIGHRPRPRCARTRHALGVRPVYKRVDTCAAEFATRTAYMYSTYEDECEAQPDRPQTRSWCSAAGPNRIGQGIEFDYCCVHAALALREDGFETIMVNCNPETVSTDYDTSDRLYFEPLTLEDVLEIVHVEKPYGVIVQFGGQTPLKLARDLEANGVPIIGTSPDSIDIAEDRERFQKLLEQAGAEAAAEPHRAQRRRRRSRSPHEIGYPLVVRPSLRARRPRDGNRARAGRPRALHARGGQGVERFAGAARPLSERRDRSRRRCDLRRQGRADRRRHGAHRAGRRAFGRFGVLAAAVSLSPETAGRVAPADGRDGACAEGRRPDERAVRDPERQRSTCWKSIRAPRAPCRSSRRRPACRWRRSPRAAWPACRWRRRAACGEVVPPYYSVKEAVFPFIKFPGADTILGPEMKSTGEVMGVGATFGEAFVKSQLAAGERLPASGKVFISVRDADKPSAVAIAHDWSRSVSSSSRRAARRPRSPRTAWRCCRSTRWPKGGRTSST